MGIYLNPGNENFRRTLAGEIYVDKTMMISVINRFIDSGNNFICISRPRRFGKTIAGNMLSSYYSKGCDSRDLFAGLKIASDPCFSEKLNQYNVIKLDLNSELQNTRDKENLIGVITEKVKAEMHDQFEGVEILDGDTLAECILKVFNKTGETFIIIIDEYDILVREQVSKSLLDSYLSFLNGLFKSDTLRPAISLAYLTGILPVVRDKIQSKLNNFEEYTILDAFELTEFVGFTSEEVQKLCESNQVDYDECRLWYDGYRQNGYEIYNPESVVKCVRKRRFDSFWGKTSTYAVISDYLRRDFQGTREAVVRMIAGEPINVNVTSYLNTMDSFVTRDDVFTYLIHVGYLAFAPMDEWHYTNGTCRIPNNEIRQEWYNAIGSDENYSETDKIIKASRELLQATIDGDADAVAKALDVTHIHVTSNRSYNNEDALHSAIYLAYIYALNAYTVEKEKTAGKGFADLVYVPVHPGQPDRPAMIVELKRNDTAESAINQIYDKQYFEELSYYHGNLLFVGINYDEKEKAHTCKIEKFVKE